MEFKMPITASEFLQDIDNFLVLPSVCIRVNEMADNPRFSAIDIANEIGKDPAITAQVLRVANSPFYNFPSRIDSLTRAISIIGTEELRNLVLVLSVLSATDKLVLTRINVDDFWRHCFFVGIMARRLARELKIPLINKERLFLAGVLHELGRLVFALKIPEIFSVIQERALLDEEPFYMVEKLAFGLGQMDLTCELMKKWHFPTSLAEMLKAQYEPQVAKQYELEASIILLANDASSEMGLAGVGDDNKLTETIRALEVTGLNKDQLLEVATDAREEYFGLLPGIYTPKQQIA